MGGYKIFPVSVSVRYSIPYNGSQQCFLEVTHFGFGSILLFQRSAVTNCLVRKYSAFIEYAHCMSGYLDTCVNVHHWLARNVSTSVMASGIDSGGLGFTSSLA
jgi:hypothetical protein